jgi:undecaprenyl pyrophosphate phosphatase UppP
VESESSVGDSRRRDRRASVRCVPVSVILCVSESFKFLARITMKQRIVVGVLLLVSCLMAGAADRKFIVKPRASDMKALPFSDAVLVGNTLYISLWMESRGPSSLPG